MQKGQTGWKSKCFLHAQYLENKESLIKRKNYGALHNIPEQNCMRNLERFRQSLLLIKILMPFVRGAL